MYRTRIEHHAALDFRSDKTIRMIGAYPGRPSKVLVPPRARRSRSICRLAWIGAAAMVQYVLDVRLCW
ncbi:hypothetical protein BJX99DRAFT_232592 [Aspergillus californicus]